MAIIEIENVSKKYVIAHEKVNPYASLKEIISDWGRQFYRKLKRPFSTSESEIRYEEFWALKDINLKVEQGDRIAILGRNGAGKSTLLKLLSRITEPTRGRMKINGRVSSLLEVGTGFHPDLTGRENILLNGAIMGMSYQEMRKKFDEIVAFAEIEQFLDTEIKRYSSGMYMRLGFAIAAHLNADLLIVDEVLAVGDAQFQEKCLKKMNEMGVEGRTVLFVSHHINSVLSLCNKGVLLERGELRAFEPIEQCVNRYIRSCPVAGLSWSGSAGDDSIQIYRLSIDPPRSDDSFFFQGDKTALNLEFEVLRPHADLIVAFSVLNARNQMIARSRLCDHPEYHQLLLTPGVHQLSFHLDLSLFHPGEYQIRLESSLLNKKKILLDDIVLKFAVYSQRHAIKHEHGLELDGISLGNHWQKNN
ncbi:MAG: polysaccharide ABC transporter ATP-binding protein [Chlamydiales bacterium]